MTTNTPSWISEGSEGSQRGTGCRRRTNDMQSRRLRLIALRDRFSSTRSIGDLWLSSKDPSVTIRIVYGRIRTFGLQTHRPHLVLPLTVKHQQQYLEWCRLQMHWNVE
ncbi:hypothetical protein Trydic_g11262 [Trypoxylus dichotomus]